MKKIVIATAIAVNLMTTGAFADASHEHGHDQENAAIGQPGKADKISRTIVIKMSDIMRFTPSRAVVKRGETVKFIVKNTGKVKHEMVLGSADELKEHAALMRKFPSMEHADPNQVSVEPGKSGEIVWQFTQPGTVEFACLQPGHMEAGMVGKVVVMR